MMIKKGIYILGVLLVLSACGSHSNEKNSKAGDDEKIKDDEEQVKQLSTKKSKNEEKELAEGKIGKMVFFEGGTITIGNDDGLPIESPEHKRNIEPFYLDKHLVTVNEFREFIKATGFKTDADKFGNAGVFDLKEKRWKLLDGANWKYPLGPDREKAHDNHPVTQVSWRDANAYCEWAGKRLPSEFEWEFAAKNGKSDASRYSWGSDIYMDGKFMANVWQGDLNEKQGADGFVYTSPVGYYGETPAGLTDMGGNVWQWCSNVFKPYPGSKQRIRVSRNTRTIKGGSFFYDDAGEKSYTVSFRAGNTIETSLFNTGFRCAKSY